MSLNSRLELLPSEPNENHELDVVDYFEIMLDDALSAVDLLSGKWSGYLLIEEVIRERISYKLVLLNYLNTVN